MVFVLFVGTAEPLAAIPAPPEAVFEMALAQTREGNYPQAIRRLTEAQELYARAGDAEGQYKSSVLAYFLAHENRAMEKKTASTAEWIRHGWLLADMNLSGHWITPPIPSQTYQGVLIMGRKLRDIPTGPGRSIPLWGILDVKTVPRLGNGEEFSAGSCHLSGQAPDGGIAALILAKGHERDPEFKATRKAWRLDAKTSRIVELPVAQVACLNENPVH